MARLLLETDLAPDQRSYADAISQSGRALLSLIEDILDFSKIESGTLVLDKNHFELCGLIEGVAELLATRAHAKTIDLVTAIAPDVPAAIQGDSVRLRQILTNLVGNAIKFTEVGGVLVAAEMDTATPDTLRITVRDTGIGVPKEKHAQIFEEFVQADSSHGRRFEGSGLGLTISKRLIYAMGGEIGISDAPDGGSIFWITLPLREASPPRVPHPGLNGKNIAVVSQSAVLAQGIKLQLCAAGANVVTVESIDSLGGTPAEIAIVDAGWNETAQIPDLAHLGRPVHIVVPPGHRATLSALRMKGYDGYLTKPVRQGSLETRILTSPDADHGAFRPASPQSRPALRLREGGGLSVLLAEDNPVNALLAKELLRRRGHKVVHVSTGTDAVSACADARFDLVIMDLHMPGLDGIEATRRIRAAEDENGVAPIPIFALTADALETGRQACQEAGMNGFLTKPVDPAALDAVIEAVSGDRAAA